jgi:hypothetical protein
VVIISAISSVRSSGARQTYAPDDLPAEVVDLAAEDAADALAPGARPAERALVTTL